jgi:hypothetical protein
VRACRIDEFMRILSCPGHLSLVLFLLGLGHAAHQLCDIACSKVERVMKQRPNAAIVGGQMGFWLMRDVIVAADGGKCSYRLAAPLAWHPQKTHAVLDHEEKHANNMVRF